MNKLLSGNDLVQREIIVLNFRYAEPNPLSAVESWAIYTEIAERPRNVLPVDHSKRTAYIEDRLNRLGELDGEPSPSIVPPMNTRWFE